MCFILLECPLCRCEVSYIGAADSDWRLVRSKLRSLLYTRPFEWSSVATDQAFIFERHRREKYCVKKFVNSRVAKTSGAS